MQILFILFFIILILFIFLALAYITSMGDGRRLRNFASEMKLELIPGIFPYRTEVRGNYRGFPVLLFIERKFLGSDSLNIYLTVPSEKNLALNIHRKILSGRSICHIPCKPVNTGNVHFDNFFLVESNKPEIIDKILTEDVCRDISTHPWKGHISLKDDRLHFNMVYNMLEDLSDNTENLIKISNIMVKIACNISGKEREIL